MAQKAQGEGICPIAEEQSLLHWSEKTGRKLLKPSSERKLPTDALSEPCFWRTDAPGAAHSNAIRRRIPGVNPSTIAL